MMLQEKLETAITDYERARDACIRHAAEEDHLTWWYYMNSMANNIVQLCREYPNDRERIIAQATTVGINPYWMREMLQLPSIEVKEWETVSPLEQAYRRTVGFLFQVEFEDEEQERERRRLIDCARALLGNCDGCVNKCYDTGGLCQICLDDEYLYE